MIYLVRDIRGTIHYMNQAISWIYGNRDRKKNKVIRGLLEIMHDMISLEELNLLVVPCILQQKRELLYRDILGN